MGSLNYVVVASQPIEVERSKFLNQVLFKNINTDYHKVYIGVYGISKMEIRIGCSYFCSQTAISRLKVSLNFIAEPCAVISGTVQEVNKKFLVHLCMLKYLSKQQC